MKMKNFIPYKDKIVIEPLKKESVIKSDENSLIEAGTVIAVGADVTFVKPGDTLYFDAWGCSKTPNGDYVVTDRSECILGKNEQ